MKSIQLQKAFLNASTPQILGLAVSLTEQCNFRCTYCYEKFELESMNDELFDGLKRLIALRIPSLRHFSLNWFGGEPLLEWKRMVELSQHCRTLCNQHNVSMPPSTVPTNAWGLTPEVLDALCNAGTSHFMVSLDGMPTDHNSTRKLISGRGTFERIYANLINARNNAQNFQIILRLHLHNDNIGSQILLAKKLASDFSSDLRFKIHPITLGNFGGEGIKSMNLLNKKNFQSIKKYINNIFRIDQNSANLDEQPDSMQVCYAAKPNHIFIRPNGMISKCTSALDRDDNNIGKLHPNGNIDIDDGKALAWSFGFKTGNTEDLACPYWTKPQEQIVKFIKP